MTSLENLQNKVMTPCKMRAKNLLYQVNFGQKSHDPVTKPVEKSQDPFVKLSKKVMMTPSENRPKKSHDPVGKSAKQSPDPV